MFLLINLAFRETCTYDDSGTLFPQEKNLIKLLKIKYINKIILTKIN